MATTPTDPIPIRASVDVVQVRQAVRALAASLGLTLIDQTKIVTAASELARNTLEHGGGGTARVEVITRGGKTGLRAIFEDNGPGIPDVNAALSDGFTTGGGLGLGLGGSKRLVHDFDLKTNVGEGTCITITRWK
ncbi:MAG TPA: anti-sigma regulatory factor [Tepidisphaeraceae bacterium]|jgi:serine/threonine-protein kinase RsbT